MKFHPDQIEREHVLEAIGMIDSSNEELIPINQMVSQN